MVHDAEDGADDEVPLVIETDENEAQTHVDPPHLDGLDAHHGHEVDAVQLRFPPPTNATPPTLPLSGILSSHYHTYKLNNHKYSSLVMLNPHGGSVTTRPPRNPLVDHWKQTQFYARRRGDARAAPV